MRWVAEIRKILAFGNDWRRRSFALAVVFVSILCAAGDAEECKHCCHYKAKLLHDKYSPCGDELIVTAYSTHATY